MAKSKSCRSWCHSPKWFSWAVISTISSTGAIVGLAISPSVSMAQIGQFKVSQFKVSQYRPIPLTSDQVNDILTERDIPTGQKGFAKDYQVELSIDDRLEISVSSNAFDPIVSLLGKDGDAIAENDDGGSDGTDSLLFVKIKKAGSYIVRVQSFGGSSGGKFMLKVTKLRPVN